MRPTGQRLGTVALVAVLLCVPAVFAAPQGPDPAELQRAGRAVERLRGELARVNAEVAALKRGNRTLRNDYRLRERMADAEALAQKLTAAEAALRALTEGTVPAPVGAPVVASPQASPQDGSVELEAKADLLVDQARKLDTEANVLARAADQLRSRKALRRKAGRWERDPFAGLETSKRNLAAAAVRGSSPTGDSSGPGSTFSGGSSNGSTQSTTADVGGTAPPPPAVPVLAPTAGADSAVKGPTASATDGAAAAKAPVVSSGLADRQAVEQRLFLDPATAAELRQALGAPGATLDPEALERGAAALRSRARRLDVRAAALRARSRIP
jgi:hypothetical protein